jgi:hypothetical protein
MKKTLIALSLCGLLAGCSAISKFYSSASDFPSAATLVADCQAGKAATPAVRSNSCDLYNAVATFCAGQANLPLNAVQACTLAGYAISGTPVLQ